MRCLTGLFLFLFLFQSEFIVAYQDSTLIDNFRTYVDNPEPTDSFCIEDIAKAKADIAQGKIIISTLSGFMYYPRYEKELEMLCRKRGYTYYNDSESCIAFEGQTQGCYTLYMNQHLRKTYGKDFLKNLIDTADSLFIENLIRSNEVFTYGDFDTDPIAVSDYGETVDIPPMIFPNELKHHLADFSESSQMEVRLIIDKHGSMTRAYINDLKLNRSDKEKFESLLLSTIKQHFESSETYWLPAEKYTIPVNAEHVIRLPIKAN